MTQPSFACQQVLAQLEHVIKKISQDDYYRPSPALDGSTVGQHIRHTLEFFVCLESGFTGGVINYDTRARDTLIETNKNVGLKTIERICEFIQKQRTDRPLKLEVGYEPRDVDVLTLDTSYFRELTYNVEHAVHHMAIMKIGIREVAPYVSVPSDFGVAASTIRYRESLTVERP